MSSANKHKEGLFQRIYRIEHDTPGLSAETWAELQPVKRIQLAGRELVLNQPSSTFWVYALGLLTCAVGQIYWLKADGDSVRQLWSIGLWLWGIGALLAGTSYQALGYHLKCHNGRVRWTNWWETIYMIFQQLSINVLLSATALSSTEGSLRTALLVAALVISVVYTLVTLTAALIPNRHLLSFEWMSLVSAPPVFVMLLINSWNAIVRGIFSEALLALVWIGLLLCMLAFWLYMRSGLTSRLWQRKRWFSENDVLHVTLIIWVIYIAAILPYVSL